MPAGLCRDCGAALPAPAPVRCSACGSPRVVAHPELETLPVAHIDCDAFYAAIEKRDDPSLRDKAVIVGGSRRGVVLTACYNARIHGVRSAMPMFKALRLCPHATIVRPNMAKYAATGRTIRTMMGELTPLVQPVSIDEAFLDLSGTQALHGATPAVTLARFAARIEREIGITVSVGLSHNKFLAKLASDADKPRGFTVIGRADALAVLRPRPVGAIWGVGAVSQVRLAALGFATIGDIQDCTEAEFARRIGSEGSSLWRLAHGLDGRPVRRERVAKSVSAETTFGEDLASADELEPILFHLCEKVALRLATGDVAAGGFVLKLKTRDFRLRTRSRADPADAARHPPLRGRPRPARPRDRRHALSPHWSRHLRPARRCRRRPGRSARRLAAAPEGGGEGHRRGAGEVRQRSAGARHHDGTPAAAALNACGKDGGLARNRTGVQGFAVLCVTTPPRGLVRTGGDPARGASSPRGPAAATGKASSDTHHPLCCGGRVGKQGRGLL